MQGGKEIEDEHFCEIQTSFIHFLTMFIRDFLPKYLGKAIGAGENLVEAPHTELVGQQMEAMKESFFVDFLRPVWHSLKNR